MMDERVSLIADPCSDRDKTEALKGLSGDDAQAFIDMIDEVPPRSHVRTTDPLT